jgi:hypothetical protein
MKSAIGKSMFIPRRTFLKTVGAILALPAILRAETGSPVTQEQKFNMVIKRIGSQPSGKAPAEYFTGTARIDPLFDAHPPARVSGGSVTFEPGARNAWHTHPLGQILIITAGCGWSNTRVVPLRRSIPAMSFGSHRVKSIGTVLPQPLR